MVEEIKELKMDISMLNLTRPKKDKIDLMLKKAKDCLEQLEEFESKLKDMKAPRSYEAEYPQFKEYWRVYFEIDKLYKWMRNIELSNYPLTSKEDLIGFIEYWEIVMEKTQ